MAVCADESEIVEDIDGWNSITGKLIIYVWMVTICASCLCFPMCMASACGEDSEEIT